MDDSQTNSRFNIFLCPVHVEVHCHGLVSPQKYTMQDN